MGFGEAVTTCFSKYFTLSGRARRSEYWYFYLFTILLSFAASILDAIFGSGRNNYGILGVLASLAVIIPTITVQVRRLHDIGRSGWWIGGGIIAISVAIFLLIGIPTILAIGYFEGILRSLWIGFFLAVFVYAITMLVFMCTDSHKGTNKYGPNPKT